MRLRKEDVRFDFSSLGYLVEGAGSGFTLFSLLLCLLFKIIKDALIAEIVCGGLLEFSQCKEEEKCSKRNNTTPFNVRRKDMEKVTPSEHWYQCHESPCFLAIETDRLL